MSIAETIRQRVKAIEMRAAFHVVEELKSHLEKNADFTPVLDLKNVNKRMMDDPVMEKKQLGKSDKHIDATQRDEKLSCRLRDENLQVYLREFGFALNSYKIDVEKNQIILYLSMDVEKPPPYTLCKLRTGH
jgi:hypothetical protein